MAQDALATLLSDIEQTGTIDVDTLVAILITCMTEAAHKL